MPTIKGALADAIFKTKEYNDALIYNAKHPNSQVEAVLDFKKRSAEGTPNKEFIREQFFNIMSGLVMGNIVVDDLPPYDGADLNNYILTLYDQMILALGDMYAQATNEDAYAISAEDMNDLLVGDIERPDFNLLGELVKSFHNSIAKKYYERPEQGYKAMTDIFRMATYDDLTAQEKAASLGRRNASPEAYRSYREKANGEPLTKESLVESLNYFKAVRDEYYRKYNSSTWFKIKSVLWGKTNQFKKDLTRMESLLVRKGVSQEAINSIKNGTAVKDVVDTVLNNTNLQTREEYKALKQARANEAIAANAVETKIADLDVKWQTAKQTQDRAIRTIDQANLSKLKDKLFTEFPNLTDADKENITKATSRAAAAKVASVYDRQKAKEMLEAARSENETAKNNYLETNKIGIRPSDAFAQYKQNKMSLNDIEQYITDTSKLVDDFNKDINDPLRQNIEVGIDGNQPVNNQEALEDFEIQINGKVVDIDKLNENNQEQEKNIENPVEINK